MNILSGRKISSLVSNGGDVERLATGFQFTEGPVWDASEGCLLRARASLYSYSSTKLLLII